MRLGGRRAHLEERRGAPAEHHHGDHRRDDAPDELERQVALDAGADFAGVAAADRRMPKTTTATVTASAKNALTASDEQIERVDVLGERRGLLGKQRKPNEPIISVPDAVIASNRHDHEPRQRQQGQRAAQLNGLHRHERIRPGLRDRSDSSRAVPGRPASRPGRPTTRSARTCMSRGAYSMPKK